jgi:hypothetical protein
VTWAGIAVIGAVAGVGFTMSLLIANLAFASRARGDPDASSIARRVVIAHGASLRLHCPPVIVSAISDAPPAADGVCRYP